MDKVDSELIIDIKMPIKLAMLYDQYKSNSTGRVSNSLHGTRKKRNLTGFIKLWKFCKEKEYDPVEYLKIIFSGSFVPYINTLTIEKIENYFLKFKSERDMYNINTSLSLDIEQIEKDIMDSFNLMDHLIHSEAYKNSNGYEKYLVTLWQNKEKYSIYFKYLNKNYREGYELDCLTNYEKEEYIKLVNILNTNSEIKRFLIILFTKIKNSKKYDFINCMST